MMKNYVNQDLRHQEYECTQYKIMPAEIPKWNSYKNITSVFPHSKWNGSPLTFVRHIYTIPKKLSSL